MIPAGSYSYSCSLVLGLNPVPMAKELNRCSKESSLVDMLPPRDFSIVDVRLVVPMCLAGFEPNATSGKFFLG
jgi:hypothetical protein